MDLGNLLERVNSAFAEQSLEFVVIGGVAVAAWIPARLTDDLDIVVPARKREGSRLKQALVAAGTRVTSLEMRLLFEKRFVLLKTSGPRLDVHVAATSHELASCRNAVLARYRGVSIRVASVEDLILYKLKAWRELDRADVLRLMYETRNLRKDYIESWIPSVTRSSGARIGDRWIECLKALKTYKPEESR